MINSAKAMRGLVVTATVVWVRAHRSGMPSGVNATSTKPGATATANANGQRLLLLLSALLVMVFTRGAQGHTVEALAAVVVAALAAGVALLRPITVRDLDRMRRLEWTLVASLLLSGFLLTAMGPDRGPADLGPPVLPLPVIAVYLVLGLAAALSGARRLPLLKWAFLVFLVAHAAMTVVLLRSTNSINDVRVFMDAGAKAVLQGQNPYAITIPNIYPPADSQLLYGPGVVVDGLVTYGFPYPPISLLGAIPGQLLGDVRYTQLIAMLVTALVLRRLASDRVGQSAAILGVAAPAAIPMLTGAWTEPTIVALLACLVLALERRRSSLVAVFLGLLLVSKQYVVIAIPVIWLIRGWLTRRMIITGVGLAAVVTLPFFLVNPPAFWRAIVEFQLVQPFRSDSLSLLAASVNTFGWPPPWTYGVLPFVGGGLTAIVLALRAPRTPAALAAAVGLTLLVTILLSKQAFMNYYFLVSGAFLIAAVAWPTTPKGMPPASVSGRHTGVDVASGDAGDQ